MKTVSDNGQEILSGTIIGVRYRKDKALVVFACDASEFRDCRREYAHLVRNRETTKRPESPE